MLCNLNIPNFYFLKTEQLVPKGEKEETFV